MTLGHFMQARTGYKCVKFRVKIPSGCSENGFRGYLILPHPVYNGAPFAVFT